MGLTKRNKLILSIVLIAIAVLAAVGTALYFIIDSLRDYKKVTLQYYDGRVVTYSVMEDKPFDRPVENAREGYAFENWYADAGCTIPFDFGSAITENTTIYAKWNPINTINFFANDGSGQTYMSFENLDYDTPLLIPKQEPSRSKYVFMGWCTDEVPGPTSIVYKKGTNNDKLYIPLNGINLYALWVRDTVSLTYDFGVGTFEGQRERILTVDKNDTYDILSVAELNPYAEGYTFLGWSTDPVYKEGESVLYSADGVNNKIRVNTQSVTLYAAYKRHSVTLRFNANTNDTYTEEVPNLKAEHNQPVLIPSTVFKRLGYKLEGWSTNPNYVIGSSNEILYVPGESWFTYNDIYQDGETVDMYAVWAVRDVEIRYDFGKGTGTYAGNEYTGMVENFATAMYGTNYQIPSDKVFTVEYVTDSPFFVGFAVVFANNNRSSIYYRGDFIDLSGENLIEDAEGNYYIIIEAQYSDSTVYEVRFEMNGGETNAGATTMDNIYVDYPAETPDGYTYITLPDLTKKGYFFLGWTTIDGNEAHLIKDEILDDPTESSTIGTQYKVVRGIKLYALFLPYSYSIAYEGNGETNGYTSDNTTYYYDETIVLKNCSFEKEGYDFIGWTLDPYMAVVQYEGGDLFKINEAENANFDLASYPDGSEIVLYALWKIKEFDVTLTPGTGYILSEVDGSASPVQYGSSYTFKFAFEEGYNKAGCHIFVNGIEVSLSDWQYTITNIREDIVVTVEGVKINTFSVKLPTDMEEYVAEAYGASVGVTDIGYGHSYSFRIFLGDPYTQSNIIVSAVDLKGNKQEIEGYNGIYVLENITTDYEIVVENIKRNTYTITLESGRGYTLEPFDGASTTVEYGASFSFKFILDERYNLSPFVLYVNDVQVVSYAEVSDGNTSYLGFLEDIRNDKVVTVTGVTINRYTVTLVGGEGYTLTPTGTSESPCDHGSNFSFRFALETPYSNSNFIISVNDVVVYLNAQNEYTITNIKRNTTVVVSGVEKNKYNITLPEMSTRIGYTISVDDSIVEYGEGTKLTFKLDKAYSKSEYVIKINKNPITVDSDGFYQIQNVTSNLSVEVSGVTMNTYTVSHLPVPQQIGYRLQGWSDNPDPLYYGDDYLFTFEVETGYEVVGVKIWVITKDVNGNQIDRVDVFSSLSGGQFTITNITNDIEIVVEGIKVIMYDIMLPKEEDRIGYTITPLDNYELEVGAGKDFKFVVELDEAFSFSILDVRTNNVEIAAKKESCSIGGVVKERNVYTISNIRETQIITVGGVVQNSYRITIPSDPIAYSVTVASGYDATNVLHGNDFKFVVTLKPAYAGSLDKLKVEINDGTETKVLTAESGVYTISNITESKVITISGYGVNTYTVTFPDQETIDKFFTTFEPYQQQSTTVDYGSTFTFVVVLKPEYSLFELVVTSNGVSLGRSGSNYVIVNITSDQTIAIKEEPTLNRYTMTFSTSTGYHLGMEDGASPTGLIHGSEVKFSYWLNPLFSSSKPIVKINGTTITSSTEDIEVFVSTKDIEGEDGEVTTVPYVIYTIYEITRNTRVVISGVNQDSSIVEFRVGTGYSFIDKSGASLGTAFEALKDDEKNTGTDCLWFRVLLDTKYNKSKITVYFEPAADPTNVSEIQKNGEFYELLDIRLDGTIYIEGIQINSYNIKIPTGEGYVVEPLASSTNPVAYGDAFRFRLNLDPAYNRSPYLSVRTVNLAGTETPLNPTSGIYTIAGIIEDKEIVVSGVERNIYSITIPETQKGYALSSIGGITSIVHGETYNMSFKLLFGYTQSNFVITINGVDKTREDITGDVNSEDGGIYTIENVSDDIVISVSNVVENTYLVTLPTGEGYKVANYDGSISTIVTHGHNFLFTVTLEAAYMESLPNMVVKYAPTDDPTDATKVDAVSGIYTIPTIFEPMTITVEGVKVSEFDITLPTGAGYTITPYNNQPTRVIYGTNFSFIIGLDEAYNESIPLVKSNGIVISRSAGVYTIEYVTAHQNVTVENVKKNTYTITLITGTGYQYDSATTEKVVEFGDDFNFTVTLLEGYTYSKYSVLYKTSGGTDDKELQLIDNKYTITNIRTNKTIYVLNVELNKYVITYPTSMTQGFTVTPIASTNPVLHGGTFKFIIALDAKYSKSEYTVTANGTEISPVNGQFIITNIRTEQDIKVHNITVNTYQIKFSSGPGYKFSAVAGFDTTVEYGQAFQFLFDLNVAYSDSMRVLIIRVNEEGIGVSPGANELQRKGEIANVIEDKTVTVSGVTKNKYNVKLSAGAGYTLTPISDSSSPVEYDDSFAFKFTLAEEYNQSLTSPTFDILLNGVSIKQEVLDDGTYLISTIRAHQNVVVEGVKRNVYSITYPTEIVGYSITSITNSTQKVEHGSSFTFVIELLPAYSDSQVVVRSNDMVIFKTDGSYTINNITENQTVTVSGVKKNTYGITLKAGEGYSLKPKDNASTTVEYDASFTFVFELLEGYTDSDYKIYIDGSKIDLIDGEFTISYIRANKLVTVDDVEMNSYFITLPSTEAQKGYTIGPATGSSSPVLYLKSYTFIFSLNTAYNKSTPVVKVNGTPVTLNDGQYTIKNIRQDMTVTVEDVKLNTYQVHLPDEIDQKGYTLRPKSGNSTTVDYNANFAFEFILDRAYDRSGYVVRVNGSPVAISNNEYTITNIREEKTITVEGVTENQYRMTFPNNQVGYILEAYNSYSPVTHGWNFTIRFQILTGYTQSLDVYKLKMDGLEIQTLLDADGLYVIENVQDDHTFTVEGIKINKYTVTFDYYVGSTQEFISYEINHGASVPNGDVPIATGRTGYNFTGWNNTFTNITSDLTISALYTIKIYAITWSAVNADTASNMWLYNANYTTSATAKTAVSYVAYNSLYGYFNGALDASLITPSRLGYEFAGWYTQNVGGTEITRVTGVADLVGGGATYYARWIATAIIVVLDTNGASGAPPVINETWNQGDVISLSQGGMGLLRHTYVGWSLDRNATSGSDTYTVNINHAKLEGETYTLTLYAIWERDTVILTFNANGGANAPEPTRVNTYESWEVTTAFSCTRSGLIFYGWCLDSNGNDTVYSKDGYSNTVKNFAVQGTNVTLYAIWAYKISYYKNYDNTTEHIDKYCIYGKSYRLETVYTIQNYTFVGWALTSGGEVEYEKEFVFEPLQEHLTLYALWISGLGTQAVPFNIATVKDWNTVVGFYGPDETIYYKQTADITEPAAEGLTRIEEFAGNYDGNGKTITLYNASGPFIRVNATATISKLNVKGGKGVYLDTYSYFGGIAIYLYGGTILNCTYSTTTTLTVTTSAYVGGIVACAYDGSKIENCTNNAAISLAGKNESFFGGIAGFADSATMTGVINTGALSATCTSGSSHNVHIGGIIGYVAPSSIVTLSNVHNTAAISSTNSTCDAGGLVGFTATLTIAANASNPSYNTGNITVTGGNVHTVGGVVGNGQVNATVKLATVYNTGTITDNAGSDARFGGLVGRINSGSSLTLENSYNTGTMNVRGYTAYYGGLVGFVTSGSPVTVSKCYNSGDITTYNQSSGPYGSAGGIIGYSYSNTKIYKTVNYGDLDIYWYSGSVYTGGIIGVMDGSSSNIEDCINMGRVASTNSYNSSSNVVTYVGGIAGYFHSGIITRTYNSGYVYGKCGTSVNAGGIAGVTASSTTISYSYNLGNVYGETFGNTSATSGDSKNFQLMNGGIVGRNNSTLTLNYCYNAGSVKGYRANTLMQAYASGGLIGYRSSSSITVTNSAWANDVSGETYNATVTGTSSWAGEPTIAGLGQSQSSILNIIKSSSSSIYSSAWDKSTVWTFENAVNNGLPFLKDINATADFDISITLNSNFGTATTSVTKVKNGSTFTVPALPSTFARTGYSLLGWSESSSASTPTYLVGDNIQGISSSKTLYAVWMKGDGTSSYPYEISSVDLWNSVVYTKAHVSGIYYKQTADLSGSAGSFKRPFRFAGVYDGGNKTLTFTSATYWVFAQIDSSATVKNLKLVHNAGYSYYQYYDWVGYYDLHVYSGGLAGRCFGAVDNCSWTVNGLSSFTYTSGTYYAGFIGYGSSAKISNTTVTIASTNINTYSVRYGGLFGEAAGTTTISNCTVNGSIGTSSIRTSTLLGGFIGYNSGNATISNSANNVTINISASGASNVGGFIGQSGGSATFTDCANKGRITFSASGESFAGGLVGKHTSAAVSLTRCYNAAPISASASRGIVCVGGLTGGDGAVTASNSYNVASVAGSAIASHAYVGGIAGSSVAAVNLNNCYNAGYIVGSATNQSSAIYAYVGGLVGNIYQGTIRDSFNIGNVNGSSVSSVWVGGFFGKRETTTAITLSNCYAGGLVEGSGRNKYIGGILGKHESSATVTASGVYYANNIAGYDEEDKVINPITPVYNVSSVSGVSAMDYTTMYKNLINTSSTFYTSATNSWNFSSVWTKSATLNSRLPYLQKMDTSLFNTTISLVDTDRGNSTVAHKVAYGSSYITTNDIFDSTGYTFAGWVLTRGTTEIDYNDYYIMSNVNADISIYTVWYAGDGTSAYPYLIHNMDTWNKFVVGMGATSGLYYKQTAHLTDHATDPTKQYQQVGTFAGIYDGNGYTINIVNANIKFATVTGTIKNLNVFCDTTLTNTSNSRYIGGVAGIVNGGKIENCTMKGAFTVNGASSGNYYVAGIVGIAWYNATVTNCTNYANITAKGASPKVVGGVLGTTDNTGTVTITGCLNMGTIDVTTTSYASYVGGILGLGGAYGINTVNISNCFNIGTITVTSTGVQAVGGLVGSTYTNGSAYSTLVVSNSYNAGFVNTSTNKTTYAGGIAGNVAKATINNTFNIGKLYSYVDSSVPVNVGGIIGYARNSTSFILTIAKSYNVGIVNYASDAMTNNAGGIVGALATTASGSYSIASNNYYVNNIGIARTAAVGSASISTGNDTFANLLAKVRNFSSDTIYSGAWSTSTWQKSTQYNNGLPFFKTMTANTTTFPITVSFGANGGSGSLSSAYVFTNSMFITPANSFSAPSGKSFVGWTTISGGTDMEYAASSFVKGLTESTTLYAVWN